LSSLEEAVDEIIKGNTSAFQRLVDATSTRLFRMSARVLGNVADAEDVVQEAYVKAYRSLLAGQFDGRSKVETWLYRIALNAAIDAKRKRGHKTVGDDELVDPGWDGRASAEARIALQELGDWLRELPEEQQTVLVLKAVEGLSSAEIAEVLECTEGAVEQRLVRARTTLRSRRNEP
jgi:RNA polymerase sigma-70 factor (ECF subfamily)